ncbi:Myozenin-2 Calsarcin-1 [Collichthys lucidus]|uniref:Myozenin-2 Calsarcin-1 n=1 Tax=Collichthys lucidus TaxID=240159 RepID=A0A4U5U2F1_COLLU|nr:Myozenin-2 Calsarcin-1 [Collichthys lucidus]
MSQFCSMPAGERKKHAAAICREVHGTNGDEMDLGKKLSTPKDIMLEELSLLSNRGSRLFKMRQRRSEKYTFESIQNEANALLNSGILTDGTHTVEIKVDPPADNQENTVSDTAAEKLNASAMPKSYHSPWEQAILSDPDLAESLKLRMPGPDPRPDLPEYKCFNRVATPFGGFDKAPRGITFKLPEVDLNPPSYPELQEPGMKRPTFNRTAQGWISDGTHLILPNVTVEPVKVPESDDLQLRNKREEENNLAVLNSRPQANLIHDYHFSKNLSNPRNAHKPSVGSGFRGRSVGILRVDSWTALRLHRMRAIQSIRFPLSQQVDRMLGKNERLRSDMFGELLQAANNTGDLRSCPIGSKWKDVASKCIRGHFQPLLLFYTNPEGSPVSNEDAPRQTTMCPRYKAQVNGDTTVKLPLSSPNKFQEPFMESLQRPSETSKKDRGHRKTDPSQYKEMAHARSSSPSENGPRPLVDQKSKSYPRSEKSSNHSSRGSQESRGQSSSTQGGGHSRRNNSSPGRYDQESCQEQWEKSGGEGSRNKSKSTWRPIREVLNVDTVLNELEQRRQQQHNSPRHSKPSSQERAHAEQSRDREREHVRTREDRKQKCLMTIYEDEQRHETESHSSVESESRANQQRGTRLKGGPKTLLRSDTWTIQRTESGYESSDRLSSGSTNPDSPGVDGFIVKDQRSTPEAQLQSQLHQKGGDGKSSITSSPSHNVLFERATALDTFIEAPCIVVGVSNQRLKLLSLHGPLQGNSKEKMTHLFLKGRNSAPHSVLLCWCTERARRLASSSCEKVQRKSKYTSSTSRKTERDATGSDNRQSEQQELTNCRGHPGEGTALRHITKTSSSEWNSSDDLALSEPEDRESAYRSSNSEAAASESQCPHITLPYHPPSNATAEPLQLNNQRQLSATGSPHLRPTHRTSQHQGETSHATFRPRMLQEPFPSSPRLSSTSYASPHRKPDISGLRTFSGASSKSGSDPERSTPSSCESEERLTGCRVEQAAPAQEVSLTTYFNVDNCMTETYRLKYHNQRPLVLSATVPRTVVVTERRDTSHTLPTDTYSQDVPKARPETNDLIGFHAIDRKYV